MSRGARAARSSTRWGRLLAIPLVLAAAAYARVLGGEFVFDDLRTIQANLALKDLGAFLAGFAPALFRAGRPVTDLTFAANYAAGGLDPFGYHLANVAIHLAAVVLVFLFTREVFRLAGGSGPDAVGVVVAGLFALHPLQSEAVSYVVQRAESLASALYLAVLLLLLEADRRGLRGRAAVLHGLAAIAFVAGLGTKVILLTAPATYLALVALVPGESERARLAGWPRRIAFLVPWLGIVGWFALVTLRGIEGAKDAGFSIPGVRPGSYALTQLRVLATYLRLLLWPSGQNVDWELPLSRSLGEPAVVLSGLLLAAIVAAAGAALWRARRLPAADAAAARIGAFGVLWFFVVLSPTSSFVPLADPLAEHRAYLASWGVFVAIVALGERLLARLEPRRRAAVAIPVVAVAWCALAIALHGRNAVWESELALWSDAAAKSPGNRRAQLNLGASLVQQGRYEAAIGRYEAALEVGGDPATDAAILNDLGVALLALGRLDDAVAPLRRAIERDPSSPDALVNLALVSARRGDPSDAERHARQALSLRPADANALTLLGELHMARGDAAGALELWTMAVRADPEDGIRRYELGLAYAKLGRSAEACAAWRQVPRLPNRVTPGLRADAERQAAALGCPAP